MEALLARKIAKKARPKSARQVQIDHTPFSADLPVFTPLAQDSRSRDRMTVMEIELRLREIPFIPQRPLALQY